MQSHVMAVPDTPPKISPSLLHVVSLRQGFMMKVLYEGFYDFFLFHEEKI